MSRIEGVSERGVRFGVMIAAGAGPLEALAAELAELSLFLRWPGPYSVPVS